MYAYIVTLRILRTQCPWETWQVPIGPWILVLNPLQSILRSRRGCTVVSLLSPICVDTHTECMHCMHSLPLSRPCIRAEGVWMHACTTHSPCVVSPLLVQPWIPTLQQVIPGSAQDGIRARSPRSMDRWIIRIPRSASSDT